MKLENTGGYLLIREISDIDLNGFNAQLRVAVRRAMIKGTTLIELDFSGVVCVNDHGLDALVSICKDARYADERAVVRISNVSPEIHDVLTLNQIDQLCDVIGVSPSQPA